MPEDKLEPKLSKTVSGYMPPEKGPFECGNCIYFNEPHYCRLVTGYIDSEGCCNLYTPTKGTKNDDEERIT